MRVNKIFYNGTIFTCTESKSFAEAIALSGRYIAAVGKNEDILSMTDENTKQIDLKGKMLMPGFIDSHAHPLQAGVEVLYKVDLNDCSNVDEYLSSIKRFIKEHSDLNFILGVGWNNPVFDSHGPTKELLDQISTEIPICLDSSDHHSIWANSRAIELAGITAGTPDPNGGIIERNRETGDPSGTFREAAQDLIRPVCPDFTVEQYKKGLLNYQKQMASYGITMAHDAMLRGDSPAHKALLELDKDDQLLFKMNASFETAAAALQQDWRKYADYKEKSQGKMFTADRVKFFIDGVIEGGTAYLKEPYANRPDYFGKCIWDTEVMEKFIIELDRAGLELHFHVIGDKATDVMLTALEKARAINGEKERRPIAAHVQLLDREDLRRLKRENVHISANPFWFMKEPGYFDNEQDCLGEKRAEKEYPMKSLFDCGLIVGSASDYSATPIPKPLEGIQLAITRSLPEFAGNDDMILGKDERISLKQALYSFTINNAVLAKQERTTGSLEPGKLADLVILEKDLFKVDPYQISQVKVIMTISEGRIIYKSQG